MLAFKKEREKKIDPGGESRLLPVSYLGNKVYPSLVTWLSPYTNKAPNEVRVWGSLCFAFQNVYGGREKTWYLLAHRNWARDYWTRSWEGEEQAVRLTFIQVDVVLPLLLVPCAVVSGTLEDVSPVSDVMPNGHLL